MRRKITVEDSLSSIVKLLSEGNPGALTAIIKIFESTEGGSLHCFDYLLRLDDMGMRGPSIWIGFKDYCEMDVEKFKKAIMERDENMVECVKKEGYHAQKSGASFLDVYPEPNACGGN